MTRRTISLMCAISFLGVACFTQTINPQVNTNTNWGENVHGVQLLIALSNAVIAVDSQIAIFAEIKNSSTNIIHLVETGSKTDFTVILTSDSGKVYKLTSDDIELPNNLRFPINLKPGENRDWSIPAILGKNIEPNNYTLKVTRSFTIDGSKFSLISNLLKVRLE